MPSPSKPVLKYFLLGAFSSALFVYGSALVYAELGSVAFGGAAAAPRRE